MGYFTDGRVEYINGNYEKALEIYTAGKENGDINAEFGIEEMRYYGSLLEKNAEEALDNIYAIYKKILKHAKRGDSESQFIIFVIYEDELLFDGGKGFGLEMLKKACSDPNNPHALWCMGAKCAELGGDYLARHNFEKAVKYPNTSKYRLLLARHYTRGTCGMPIDHNRAFELLKLSAEAGLAEAQFDLCGAYLHGRGTEVNTDEALKWCREAINNGNEDAAASLSELIYRCNVINNELFSDSAIENMKELYESGEIQCQDDLRASLVHMALTLAESEKTEGLLKSEEHFEYLTKLDGASKESYPKQFSELFYRLGLAYESREDYRSAINYYEKAISMKCDKAMFNLATLYYEGKNGREDYKNALYYFKKCTLSGIEEGRAHYYIGSCFYWGLGVPADFENAKKHFTAAYEYGFNCGLTISLLNAEDGEKRAFSVIKQAETIKRMKLSEERRYFEIIKGLQTDFGKSWEKTDKNTKKFLATGVDAYVSQFIKGPHTWGEYDFSSCITLVSKALENEMRSHLFSNYIHWLNSRGISPKQFIDINGLSKSKFKRTVIKRTGEDSFEYEDPTKNDKFTLGGIHLTVGKDKGRSSPDKTMLDYLDFILSADAFDRDKRQEEIEKYCLSLTDSLWNVSLLYRNPAAHTDKMSPKQAAACIDCVIPEILIDFLNKADISLI